MKRQIITAVAVATLGVIGTLAWVGEGGAVVSNSDYAAQPPFVSDVTTPNILVLMDNSGSMSNRACESSSCGKPAGSNPVITAFTNTTEYSGYFDPLQCYEYDTTDKRFEYKSTKTSLGGACADTTVQWDGNFLNWATFRRVDAVKKAMTGGNCSVARASNGTCPASGSPSLKTIRAQVSGVGTETASIPKLDNGALPDNQSYVNRIPSTFTPSTPGTLYIHVSSGYFCIDNDGTFDGASATSCNDSYVSTRFDLTVGNTSEPAGVIQQIGSKARFGLAVFNASSNDNGMRVLTGLGGREAIDYNGNTVEQFATNTAAMIDSVDESFPDTWTPLAESLYDAARYIAQINSAFYPSAYTYPIAFSASGSNGVSFQNGGPSQSPGIGSFGGKEISALTGSETCPTNYIANACGRDPYFFGSNHTPAWSANSKVVNCCKTFVIIFTDGEPTMDRNIPGATTSTGACSNGTALCDIAHAHHPFHCTGSDATAYTGTPLMGPPVDGTCNTAPNTPFADLLREHKTDYASEGSHFLDDVAYWAHTTDLRPCNGAADGTITGLSVTGHCLPGMQNLTVYTFFAFGNINGREILSKTAQVGGFDDANNDGVPQLNEYDKENNLTGSSIPDGIPDAYFESSNVEDLQDKLLATLSSILRKSSSGSSVSVLANAATGEGALYQAYFYPSTLEPSTLNDVKWIGYTQGLFIDKFGNIREDTVQDGKLVYKDDLIVKTRFESSTGLVRIDKFKDGDGDGLPDDKNGDKKILYPDDCETGNCNLLLKDVKPLWEAGRKLAERTTARNLYTWIDSGIHDGIVDDAERIDFTTTNKTALRPYLRAATDAAAEKIINFIHGCDAATCSDQVGLRDRRLQTPAGSDQLKTWRLGDIIHSTPTVVAAPKDRYDVIYGDTSYSAFLQKYFKRRQVVYVGGNDGMLHAFNAGFFVQGDKSGTPEIEQFRFETTRQADSTQNPASISKTPELGEELWGFIPHELLPQLEWLTLNTYQHAYYVDLPPTVADVRIFPNDTDHPNGWGTILIGGFRMGGSCGGCTTSGAPKMEIDFGGTTGKVPYYSAYFVLDITNPEAPPKLLWSFSDNGLGLTTSAPAVVRVNPSSAVTKADNSSARWFMVVGSGPTGYDATSTQNGQVFAVDLQLGPKASGGLTSYPLELLSGWKAFVGDVVSLDRNLDFRTDSVYFGTSIHDGTLPWRGKLYRLTMGTGKMTPAPADPFGAQTDPTKWGISSSSARRPTEMLDTFPAAGTYELGPVTTAPGVAVDDAAQVWVFAGSGRFLTNSDKTDLSVQYVVGIKDSVLNGGCPDQTVNITSCRVNNLINVTDAKVCIVGVGNCGQTSGTNQVTGVTGASTFTGLIGLVQANDGWFTKLMEPIDLTLTPPRTVPLAIGERVVNPPTVFGGIVFFPTYIPTTDICSTAGQSRLYALFYKTGSAYQEAILGSTASGSNQNVNRFVSIGDGLAFGAVTHIGSGSDGNSPFQLLINMSQGNFATCTGCNGGGWDVNVAIDPRSRYFSWMNM